MKNQKEVNATETSSKTSRNPYDEIDEEVVEEMVPKLNDEDSMERQSQADDSNAPVDSGIVYFTFFMYGIGSLIPWNACLNTFDFF
jgi:hypothetical protein